MSKIVSIATAVPQFKYSQDDLFAFADKVYSKDAIASRKLKFLYHQSGINYRHSVIEDFNKEDGSLFCAGKYFGGVDERMNVYHREAILLSASAFNKCIEGQISKDKVTHLITVTCTGVSAPGLDVQLMDMLALPSDIVRTSVNFMGCYAAIHALKLADAFICQDPDASVVIVCTELCTLHFQEEAKEDNILSSLLFGDGAAAVLLKNDNSKGLKVQKFFSEVALRGNKEMAWEVSSKGFLMTLTGYVPELIKTDFKEIATKALASNGLTIDDIDRWCIHPGGKKILEAIETGTGIKKEQLRESFEVLSEYGNMSSPTILFVLEKILKDIKPGETVFGAAFGPGLTMETFTAVYD